MADPFSCRHCGKFLTGDQEFVCADCAAKAPPAHLRPELADAPRPAVRKNKKPWKLFVAIGVGALTLLFGTGYLLAADDLDSAKAKSGKLKAETTDHAERVCGPSKPAFEAANPYNKEPGTYPVIFHQERFDYSGPVGEYEGRLPKGWEFSNLVMVDALIVCDTFVAKDGVSCNGFRIMNGEYEVRLLELKTAKELARTTVPTSATPCPPHAPPYTHGDEYKDLNEYTPPLDKTQIVEFLRPFVEIKGT